MQFFSLTQSYLLSILFSLLLESYRKALYQYCVSHFPTVISNLTLRSLIRFELRAGSSFVLLHVGIQVSKHHWLQRLPFLRGVWLLCQSSWLAMWGHSPGFSTAPLVGCFTPAWLYGVSRQVLWCLQSAFCPLLRLPEVLCASVWIRGCLLSGSLKDVVGI